MTALGVIAFVVALLGSVMLHEYGHYRTARHFGMKVTQFFVGFGPTLWSTHRGECEYGVKAIPAGGFVKIIGMNQLEEVESADEGRAFWRQPWRRRTVVLSAGSMMHFVIGFVLLAGVLATVGDLRSPTVSTTIDSVSSCIPTDPTRACSANDPPSPALRAGLQKGDRILAIDGMAVSTWEQVQPLIRSNAGHQISMTVARAGTQLTLRMTPVTVNRPAVSGPGSGPVGFVGIAPRESYRQFSVLGAVEHTPAAFGAFVVDSFKGLGRIPASIPKLLSGKPRDGTGPAGVIDIARVSGQIAAAHISIGYRIGSFLLIIASLNIFIGIFNLLPLLPLDGGHIAIVWFEQVRAWLARRLRRPPPGRVDLLKVVPLAYAVIAVFVGLSVLLLVVGIVNPIRIN